MRSLLLTTVLVLVATPCQAVLVFIKGQNQPVAGRIVRQDAGSITLRIESNGRTQTHEIRRTEIDEILDVVDKERLKTLKPDKPADYRDYAEELAEKRRDPDARDASIRLYLIAAYLDPDALGRSALLGMIRLARGKEEERKFRAMAYLLDPDHDRSLLKQVTVAKQPPNENAMKKVRSDLLKALRAMRKGQHTEARNLARKAPVKELFQQYESIMPYDDFMDMRANSLTPTTLRQILQLELTLMKSGQPNAAPAKKKEQQKWSEIIAEGSKQPAPSLTLETITEFDPRKCVFQDDKWSARNN